MGIGPNEEAAVRIAVVQFEPTIGDAVSNFLAIERLVRECAAQAVKIVVLPELAVSGYVFRDREELAEVAELVPTGNTSQKLAGLAIELGIFLVCGLAERDGDKLFNTAVFCGPEGFLGKYRKLHLWDRENSLFSKGDLGLPVFDTGHGRIGIAICYDGWFPELFRHMALEGADLVCIPTNWVPMPGGEAHPQVMANILIQAAAHTNGLFIASADRIGIERGQQFIGHSLIVGPTGWPLAGPASIDEEEILFADLLLAAASRSRSLNQYNDLIADRRSDVYG